MLVDTHTHLYLDRFSNDRPDVIRRAVEAGVERFYLPNVDRRTIEPMLAMERDYPGRCFPMMGLHPCSVQAGFQEELALVREWLKRRPFCAIGEIGLDFYWDLTFVEQQEEAFRTQVAWALEFDLPIVIHSRDSIDRNLQLLEELAAPGLRGIFHCFTGTLEQARRAIDLGFLLGIGGVLTFKNGGIDQVVPELPLEALVLETDAPYLAPVPYRGKRNESAYVRIVAEKLADLKGLSLEEVATATTANAEKLFGHTTFAGA